MEQFEYKIKAFEARGINDVTNCLNDFGNEGWELVNIDLHFQPDKFLKYLVSNVVLKRKICNDSSPAVASALIDKNNTNKQ